MAGSPINDVLSKLDGVTGGHGQWSAKCPCRNDDDNPSLRIAVGKEDQVMLKCLRGGGCSVDEIVGHIGMEMKDLFPEQEQPVVVKKPIKRLENTYKYYGPDGDLVMEVLRYRFSDGRKTFQQRRPNPTGGWIWNMRDVEKPLYRLPQVLRAIANSTTVFVVEGEKDVETLESLGKVATTNPGGAGGPGQHKWLPNHTAALAGGKIALITDNDEPGRLHVKGVKAELVAAGCDVKVLAPPEAYKDVTDMVNDSVALSGLVDFDIDSYVFSDDKLNAPDAAEVEPEYDPIDNFISDIEHIRDSTMSVNDAINAIRVKSEILHDTTLDEDINRGKHVQWRPFLEEEADVSYDWIIPNLLERQERVIVVAAEGAGKTTLARQVAMLCAAGIHPFKRTTMTPLRTLMIDLENPERIIRRTTGKIYKHIQATGRHEMMEGAHLVMKPDGVNLLKAEDRSVIEQYVHDTNPDILFLGPLYKAFLDPGGLTAEAVSGQIARFLDHLRVTYDCAMWIEHHAPLGSGGSRDLRPFGSAVWSRWSEFGIALKPDPTDPELIMFDHYRGQREPREWPIVCKRGNTWPFEVVEFQDFDPNSYKETRAPTAPEIENLANRAFDENEETPW